MRGVAAIVVVIAHVSHGTALSGYLAVDFFFLLSGFVISRAFEPKLRLGMGFGEFVMQRIIRLYPLFALGMLIGLAARFSVAMFDPMTAAQIALSFALNIFMLPSPATPLYSFPINPPAWSLFFEFAVNLLFAATITRLKRRALVVIIAASAALLVWCAHHYGTLNLGSFLSTSYGGAGRTVFAFTSGVLIASLHSQASRRSSVSPFLLLALAGCLFVDLSGKFRMGFDLLFAMVLAPCLLWAGASVQPPRQFAKFSQALGDISYPLYAIHFPLMWLFEAVADRFGWHSLASNVAFMICAVTLSWMTTQYWDAPIRRRVTRWVRSRGESSPQTVSSTVSV